MSTMVAEVYEAFLSVGVEQGKAKSAAEAIYSQQKEELASKDYIDKRIAEVQGDIKLNRFILLAVFAVQVIPYLKTLFS